MWMTQLHLSFKQTDTLHEGEAASAMQKGICDVRVWMRQDQLMLYDDKTEFLIIGTHQQLSKVSVQSIKVRHVEVSPLVCARNLGTWLNAHLDIGIHITKMCRSTLQHITSY